MRDYVKEFVSLIYYIEPLVPIEPEKVKVRQEKPEDADREIVEHLKTMANEIAP